MIADPITSMLSDLQMTLEQMDWPTPQVLARALDLNVISGPVAAINLEPPPTIHLPDHINGFWRSHVLAHEIAHALLKWRGIDDQLLAYYAPECAYSNLEALANYIAGLICFPQPFFEKTMRRFGFGPQALVFMADSMGAPLKLAMERVVYESDSYNRAAMVFKRGYLYQYTTTIWLDTDPYTYVPIPEARFPGIHLAALDGQPGMVLGTWGG